MKEKDFEKQKLKYFDEVIGFISRLEVDIVILAGPGFMKEDIKKYIAEKGVKIEKKLFYATSSDAERSGIREVMQSAETAKILESEHVKKEFEYLNIFFSTLPTGKSVSGVVKVRKALDEYQIGVLMVNDSVINKEEIKELLDIADKSGVKIEIFNSDDEAGKQLAGFKDIAGIEKSLLK
jgi:protein pelota